MIITDVLKGILYMMRKRLFNALILIFMLAFISACSPDGGEEGNMGDHTDNPLTNDISTPIKGGSDDIKNANLAAVSINGDDSTSKIALSFNEGSRVSGDMVEEKADGVPSYTIGSLNDPQRIIIELPEVEHWDYEFNTPVYENKGVFGLFKVPMEKGYALYVQLSGESEFSVESVESYDNNIEINLKVAADQTEGHETSAPEKNNSVEIIGAGDGQKYYCVADAYHDYLETSIIMEGMTPILSQERGNILLISDGFDFETEAEQFKNNILMTNPSLSPEKWKVVPLSKGEFPSYDHDIEYTAVYEKKVLRIDGVPSTADVFIPDGVYLCTDVRNGDVLYSQRKSFDEGQETHSYEELWLADSSGEKKRVLNFEFYTIERAAFSPSGHLLAVLERTEEGANLYAFNTNTWELAADLTSEGFGSMISSFTWDQLGTKIYAICLNEGIALHEYDFSVPSSAKRHLTVYNGNIDEGSLGFHDGRTYFSYSDMDDGAWIYNVMPKGGVSTKFHEGSAFALSKDGVFMALSTSSDFAAQSDSTTGFRVINLSTGEDIKVDTEFPVNMFCWSGDSNKLYIIENRLSGSSTEAMNKEENSLEPLSDPYPYTLWEYTLGDGSFVRLCDLYSTTVVAGVGESLYFTDNNSEGVFATYKIR